MVENHETWPILADCQATHRNLDGLKLEPLSNNVARIGIPPNRNLPGFQVSGVAVAITGNIQKRRTTPRPRDRQPTVTAVTSCISSKKIGWVAIQN